MATTAKILLQFRRPFTRPEKPAINEVDFIELTDGSVDLSEVIGRKVEVSFLLHDLLDNSKNICNQFKALGIAGAAGSGKTTVCQMMFNSPQVQERFLPRIWVCMTKQSRDEPDEKVTDKQRRDELVQLFTAERILTCLGEDEEIIKEKRKIDGISGMVSLLHRQLVGKRYLIVLDNVCYAGKWYNLGSDYSIQHQQDKGNNFNSVHSTDWGRSLGFGLPKGYGGAVIVNGRSDKVVEMMVGKENLHHLLPLRDEDCWAIFKKATVGDPEGDPQVEELRRFVVEEAGGHPLMAKLMGQFYDKVTAEESENQQDNSSNDSSVAQVLGPEASSQITAPQLVNSRNGSSGEEIIGRKKAEVIPPQGVDSKGVKENWPSRLKSLGSLRVKSLFGVGGSKPTDL